MAWLRKNIRLALLGLHLLLGMLLSLLFLSHKKPDDRISLLTVVWLRLSTRILGIEIEIHGTPLTKRTLFVANHLSWLDIPVIGQFAGMHFLAKAEIRHWPLIGWLASRSGTLYLQRGKKHSSDAANAIMQTTMKKGGKCLLFAEGTTSDGHLRKFHSRLMQSAIDARAMVQPVAVFYPAPESRSTSPALDPRVLFVGDTTMKASAARILRAKTILAEVHFLEPVSSAGKDRQQLAAYCQEKVAAAIARR